MATSRFPLLSFWLTTEDGETSLREREEVGALVILSGEELTPDGLPVSM